MAENAATLDAPGAYALSASSIVVSNNGTLKVTDFTFLLFKTLVNRGYLQLEGTMIGVDLDGSFLNSGTLNVGGKGTSVYFNPAQVGTLVHSGGRIFGKGQMSIQGWTGLPGSGLVWSGGTIETLTGDSTQSTVRLDSGDLVLNSTALSGRVDVLGFGSSTQVTGSVGVNVHLHFNLAPPVTTFVRKSGPGAYENRGTISVTESSGISATLSFPGLINQGTLAVEGDGTVFLEADTIINHGLVTVNGASDLRVVDVGSGSVFRNSADGTVDVDGTLSLEAGTVFHAAAGSSQSGALFLEGATLRGTGTVGAVVSTGGVVTPGAPIGTLTAQSLELDGASKVEFEVTDTVATGNDHLIVLDGVTYAGTLSILTPPPFEGGRCGQVVPLLEHDPGVPATGHFGKFIGLSQGLVNAWRVDTQPGVMQIAGYFKGTGRVYLSESSVVVTEGEPAVQYHACLGSIAPTAPVSVAATGGGGRLLLSSPRTFDVADWRLPRTLSVQGMDDALAQLLEVDTVVHTVSSADPTYSGLPGIPLEVVLVDDDLTADLALTQVSQEDNKFLGDVMNTVFRVSNLGAFSSTGSTVTTTPLVGLTFLSATGATCSVDGSGVVTCLLGPLVAGAQQDFTLTFQGAAVGLHTQTLTVVGAEPDPVGTNDAVVYTQRVN